MHKLQQVHHATECISQPQPGELFKELQRGVFVCFNNCHGFKEIGFFYVFLVAVSFYVFVKEGSHVFVCVLVNRPA